MKYICVVRLPRNWENNLGRSFLYWLYLAVRVWVSFEFLDFERVNIRLEMGNMAAHMCGEQKDKKTNATKHQKEWQILKVRIAMGRMQSDTSDTVVDYGRACNCSFRVKKHIIIASFWAHMQFHNLMEIINEKCKTKKMETEVMITSRWRQRELVLAAVFFFGWPADTRHRALYVWTQERRHFSIVMRMAR